MQEFSNARDVVKLDLSLFKIADDAYEPTPGRVSILSVLNGYEYFQPKRRNAVSKRAPKTTSGHSTGHALSAFDFTSDITRKACIKFVEYFQSFHI